MVLIAWPHDLAGAVSQWPAVITALLLLGLWVGRGNGMTDDTISILRQDTRNLFYHGYSNYLAHAFPEDELKPISCRPQTRNRDNPADIGLNDVLGNYSLTLIDSLSSLAILASAEDETDGHHAQEDFQSGVRALVELYGDGRDGSCGSRACAFDLDSKVQVFETNIRGVGGLLSAHLFAIGELPIRGYKPNWRQLQDGTEAIDWAGWNYEGQLLGLAHDLASRLLPAFNTTTGLPYPRVNLRSGIPFYGGPDDGICLADGTSMNGREITETCTAGAGSLVLEFTTLSRLTGDPRFEVLAKKAFWSVWDRRSALGLVAGGIDAETGQWILPPLAGVGAGVDSFFEYALKSHILLSNLPYDPARAQDDFSDSFLFAWEQAHAAVKRHLYRSATSEKHPFYGVSDLVTGAPRYSWVDNLSAYYPGLLTLAGELEEAIESHLLYAALWTRYSALPERWQVYNAVIDSNFKHWAGRPEFIESTYYLYQATKDPFYLHVGEMTLRDIRRRCWTKCGWADLGDVVSGEQRDRMESFFLGETAKYLYLLFEPEHPMNHLDAPVVFTTEGHPLTIPKPLRQASSAEDKRAMRSHERSLPEATAICPVPPPSLPLTVSNIANRADLFHAAALAQLHLVPAHTPSSSPILETSSHGPGVSMADIYSPTNYTFYPWTLPQDLTPANGYSSAIIAANVSTLTFPNLSPGGVLDTGSGNIPLGNLYKVLEGVVVNSLSNLRLNMVEEPKSILLPGDDGSFIEMEIGKELRVHGIANFALGRDEKVILSNEALRGVSPVDPYFTRIKDLEMIDLVIDVPAQPASSENSAHALGQQAASNASVASEGIFSDLEAMLTKLLTGVEPASPIDASTSSQKADNPSLTREIIPAILPTGAGAAPLPVSMDTETDPSSLGLGSLPFHRTLLLTDTLCTHQLPASIAKSYSILVINRGGCSFNDKLANIPVFAPAAEALQLVIIVSAPEPGVDSAVDEGEEGFDAFSPQPEQLIRPLLDLPQLTPHGFERRNAISMVMVDGSAATVATLRRAAFTIAGFNEDGEIVEEKSATDGGVADDDDHDEAKVVRPGFAIKRRFWFESLGVPIKNLIML